MSLSLDLLEAHPDIIKRLKFANISRVGDVILKSAAELQICAQITQSQSEAIREQATRLIYPITDPSITVLDKLNSSEERLPTGCESIDKVLHGGILCQGITELTGESACGKTQICMQLALRSQLVKRRGSLCNCLYICTEDAFPSSRFLQLQHFMKIKHPELSSHRFTDNVLVEHLSDKGQLLATLEHRVPKLLDKGRTNLIIIDSLTAVFRGQEKEQTIASRSKDISAIGVQLHKLADKYRVAILCVNQVTANMNINSLEKSQPALGLMWSNLVTTRLQVSRPNPESPIRILSVKFAPHLDTNYCDYTITQSGVVPSTM